MILCADDYGISPAVNEGILELIERRRVSATSCMMTWSNLETGAAQLQRVKAKFELGLHIVLTNGRPLTSHPMHSGLLDTHGNFLSFGGLLKRSYLNQISHGAVFCEIQAQYQRFVDLMGRDPDFIDGHQHIQQLPIIREAVLAAVRSRSKGQKMYVRVAGLPLSWCASGLKHSAGFVGRNLLIGLPGRALQKLLERNGVSHNRFLLGCYDYEGGEKFNHIFCRYLTVGPGRRDIFFCHPGRVDDTLRKRDSVVLAREETFNFLSSPQFGDIMEERGIELAPFFNEKG